MLGLLVIFCREAFARFFLFLSLKNLSSQSGVGLIGVMISAAVMVPVALVSIQIHKNMLVAQKDVERRYSVDHLFQDIRAELGDVVICTRTLRTYLVDMKLPTEEEGTAGLPSIKSKDGTGDLHVKGGIYEGGNVKIKEMEVSHLTRETLGGNTGTATFTSHFEKGSAEQVGLTDFKPRGLELMVVMNLDVAGEPTTVKRCWAKFAGQNLSLLESCKGRIAFVRVNCLYQMPAWLLAASTSDEIVELTGDNEVIWHEGTWNGSNWCTSSTPKEHCKWMEGRWLSGTWNNGYWCTASVSDDRCVWEAGEWFGSPVDGIDWQKGVCNDKTPTTPPVSVCYDVCVSGTVNEVEVMTSFGPVIKACVISEQLAHEQMTTNAVCKEGYTGACQYKCNDGTWNQVSNTCRRSSCSEETISSCIMSATADGYLSGSCPSTSTGECRYQCNDGTWKKQSNTCKRSCEADTIAHCKLSWKVHSRLHNGRCVSGSTGECTYRCNDGTWDLDGNTCKRKCVAATESDLNSEGGVVRSRDCIMDARNHGYLSGRCSSTYTGSCSYRCNDGDWDLSDNTCKRKCVAATESDLNSEGSVVRCKMDARNHGKKSGECATAGYLGGCKYKCNDGTWDSVANNTCSPPNDCNPSEIFGCSLSSASHGAPPTRGTCASTHVGSCSYRCVDGTWEEDESGGVCEQASKCFATKKNNCSLSDTAHGNLQVGTCIAGYTGNCLYECNNATWQWDTNTCRAVPRRCPAETKSDLFCKLEASGQGGFSGKCEEGYVGECRHECNNGTWERAFFRYLHRSLDTWTT